MGRQEAGVTALVVIQVGGAHEPKGARMRGRGYHVPSFLG